MHVLTVRAPFPSLEPESEFPDILYFYVKLNYL
jgi:hypothetical protein